MLESYDKEVLFVIGASIILALAISYFLTIDQYERDEEKKTRMKNEGCEYYRLNSIKDTPVSCIRHFLGDGAQIYVYPN